MRNRRGIFLRRVLSGFAGFGMLCYGPSVAMDGHSGAIQGVHERARNADTEDGKMILEVDKTE